MNFRKIRIKIVNLINKTRLYANARVAKNYVKKEVKLGNCYVGSKKEYIEEVLPYWEKYGYKPEMYWYQYYNKLQKKFNPRVIPGDLFQQEIMPYLNDMTYHVTLGNKIYSDEILYDLNKAKTIIKYVNGFLMNDREKFIDKSDIELILKDYDRIIIKPMDGEKGYGVEILDLKNDYSKSINNIYSRLDNQQFLIQEVIKQSQQLMKFNSSSVNTLRVISLLINNRVEILSSIIRVGAKGSLVDNYHQGGDTRPVDANGVLKGYLMRPDGFYDVDIDGNKIQNEKIIGYEKVINEIKRVHPRFPHARWMGWDFAIDENYEPVFIEVNIFAGDNQREDGPMFAHVTDELLDEFFKNRFKKRFEKKDV